LQDRTYTPPVIDPFGKSRANSSSSAAAHVADVDDVPKEEDEDEEEDEKEEEEKYPSSSINEKKRSSASSSDGNKNNNNKNDDEDEEIKLAEQDLTKDGPDVAAQEEEFESYGFAHPAVSRPQRVVWIPKDTHGLTEEEVKGCEEAKVRVGFRNAKLDETGGVDIDGGPPDLI
jgi:calcium permeable stress-gated cation channel